MKNTFKDWLTNETKTLARGDYYQGFNGTRVQAVQLDFERTFRIGFKRSKWGQWMPIERIGQVTDWLVWAEEGDCPFILSHADFAKTYRYNGAKKNVLVVEVSVEGVNLLMDALECLKEIVDGERSPLANKANGILLEAERLGGDLFNRKEND